MKRLIKKADANLNMNTALYEKASITSGDYIVKAEVLEEIINGMEWTGNSEFTPESKSNDWYSPNDPGEISLEAEGTFDVTKLTNKFGNVSNEDLQMIVQDLEDNDVVKDELKEVMDEFKDDQIGEYSIGFKVSYQGNVIKIEAKGAEFQPNEY